MKTVKFLLSAIAITASASALSAQSETVPPPSNPPGVHDQARQTYIDGALVQVQTYRREIDAAMKAAPAEPDRYAEANRLLKELEVLISRLRSAAPSEFDAVKVSYERTREALDRSLGRNVN